MARDRPRIDQYVVVTAILGPLAVGWLWLGVLWRGAPAVDLSGLLPVSKPQHGDAILPIAIIMSIVALLAILNFWVRWQQRRS